MRLRVLVMAVLHCPGGSLCWRCEVKVRTPDADVAAKRWPARQDRRRTGISGRL